MGNGHEYYRKRIVSLQKQHRDVLHRLAEAEAERDDYKAKYLSRQESYVTACEALKAQNVKLQTALQASTDMLESFSYWDAKGVRKEELENQIAANEALLGGH